MAKARYTPQSAGLLTSPKANVYADRTPSEKGGQPAQPTCPAANLQHPAIASLHPHRHEATKTQSPERAKEPSENAFYSQKGKVTISVPDAVTGSIV